jgi:hypothetical protein
MYFATNRHGDLMFSHWQAVEIPHYAPIANIIQMPAWWRVNDDSVPQENRKLRPGDVALAGEAYFFSQELLWANMPFM